jgi:hypothetical protein
MTAINQELYEALVAAGAPDDLAKRAAANILSRDDVTQLATKLDIADLKTNLAEVKSDLIKWMVGTIGFMTTLFVVIVKFL